MNCKLTVRTSHKAPLLSVSLVRIKRLSFNTRYCRILGAPGITRSGFCTNGVGGSSSSSKGLN